ncbi:CD225/dispanin family protein [Gordonia hankookensis]|uniref:CD225/dispanin family protein n=1 Tax=Gordonia hankookensis TaxID=589403 RepID=A0ABR7WEM4_9ACTN|nr:CD225/dispanin family protein [Gordonia hankookensis]MBD1320189.1 CD225/dispanin family protein [Gordonia hankookensis]NDZ93022.1 CD225/dispanin family protein [Streptomyces sp. SID11726]NEB22855.1 CD225/dispanin family protein [Streptomyces sp. SID6673]NED60953.1 CD225/dispanin family protein [Streptomyces sp. SID10244]
MYPYPMPAHHRDAAPAPRIPSTPPVPPTNAGWVVAAVIFFWPVAFAAANHSSRVFSLWSTGDYVAAQHASERAKALGKIALVVWAVLLVVMVVFYGAAIAMAISASSHTG